MYTVNRHILDPQQCGTQGTNFCIVHIPQSDTFVTKDECTLTHHYHPKSMVYTSSVFVVCLLWVWTYIYVLFPHKVFSLLYKPIVFHIFILYSPLTTGNHCSLHPVFAFSEYHINGIIPYVTFSDRIFS